ncbi:hypothetical protein ACWIUD_11245 [Helicobacter sp. 23-1044]
MPLMPLALIGCVVLFYKTANKSAKKLKIWRLKQNRKEREK